MKTIYCSDIEPPGMVSALNDCQEIQRRDPCPNKDINLAWAILTGKLNVVFDGHIRRILDQHREDLMGQMLERLAVVSYHSGGHTSQRHKRILNSVVDGLYSLGWQDDPAARGAAQAKLQCSVPCLHKPFTPSL
jgi:hypothetical protein